MLQSFKLLQNSRKKYHRLRNLLYYSLIFLIITFILKLPILAFDQPELGNADDTMIELVRTYNNSIVKIHDKISIPLPFFGAPPFYYMHSKDNNSEENAMISECVQRRSSIENRTPKLITPPTFMGNTSDSKSESYAYKDLSSGSLSPPASYHCRVEFNKWKDELPERRRFHREFCKDSEELAYLDFYSSWKPLTDPYEKCINLRDDKTLNKDKENIQEHIANFLSVFTLPPKINYPSRKQNPKLDTTFIQLEKEWESFIIRLGVLDTYIIHYPKKEMEELYGKSWDSFIPQNDAENYFSKLVGEIHSEYGRYLRTQIYNNTEKYKNNSLIELKKLSKDIINLPDWDLKDKKLLQETDDCINNLFQKNKGMSAGFYLGFYKKYSNKYEIDNNYKKSLQDNVYLATYNKIQKLYWRQNQGSTLFKKRLDYLNSSCKTALQKDEKDLKLKYFLNLIGE